MEDLDRVLHVTQYDAEIWDWHTNKYIADISHIIVGGISIDWTLNDAESLDFSIDLVQFEKMCAEMGTTPEQVLTPYVHDIRLRRNGEYILGCQIVETNIEIPNNGNVTIQVRCTGFLNLFKDRYISEPLAGYTYAEVARMLVKRGQEADPIIKNPTGDIDTSYWLTPHGSIYHYVGAGAITVKTGAGCIGCTRSGNGWLSGGTQMQTKKGVPLHAEVWVSGQGGRTIYFREREYINQSSNQISLYQVTPSSSNTWVKVEFDFTPTYDNGYLLIESERTDSTNLFIDDCWVTRIDDEDSLHDFKVALGVDTATPYQKDTREFNYSLQNIKDALRDLTTMEDDNFDFSFSSDRTFNCYYRKGEVKSDIVISYPGNIDSMTISRSAANLANKIQNIGSGIGDERLEVWATDRASREKYGTRESVVTNNNVQIENTLTAQAEGMLKDSSVPTNLPEITVSDGSINPSNIQVGDSIFVKIENNDDYLSTIDGYYRIMQIQLTVNSENMETVKLTLEPGKGRELKPRKVRYIKDYIHGSTNNNSNHWTEIEAYTLSGENVALNATVSGCDGGTYVRLDKVTNGEVNVGANQYAATDKTPAAVLIDLGAEYEIANIKVWHYFGDGRSYKNNTLSVGVESDTTLTPLETVVWQYSGTAYLETARGNRGIVPMEE